MAYSYYLEIATTLTPKEILDKLARQENFRWEGDFLRAPGTWVTAHFLDEEDQAFTVDTLGFRPTLTVAFRTKDSKAAGKTEQVVNAAVLELLHEVAGDAVLQSEDPTVILQRRHGVITVNRGWSDWPSIQALEPTCAVAEFPPL